MCNRLPRSLRYIVPYPIDEILELAAADPGVENLTNLELWQTVHLDEKGNSLNATRKRVGHMRLQEADVEDGMDVHAGGEVESEK